MPEKSHKAVPRAWTEAQVDAAVVMEERVISAPLPEDWGAPDVCDEIHFLRFRLRDNSTVDPKSPQKVDPANTDAMLVMLPGIEEGSNGFEYLGRQLVYMAKTQNNLNLEAWAVERRNNRIEELTALPVLNYLEEQLAAGKMTALDAGRKAIDFCYHGGTINGQKFTGWLSDKDVPYLAEFGLKLDTEDVFKVIQTMVPDPAVRKQKVFVGGHSMGGMMTSFFAGWDLDGDPGTTGDAGYNNCAGLFGFDTFVSSLSEMIDPTMTYVPAWLKDILKEETTEKVYANLIKNLRAVPTSNRILPFPLLNAEAMGVLEVLGMVAYYDPEAECTLINELPLSYNLHNLLSALFSRDLPTFYDRVPELPDFRLTNEAMLGVIFDDSFVPLGMIQNSMGFISGGTVVHKSFPLDYLKSIPVFGDVIASSFGQGPYYIPNDAGPSTSKLGKGPLYTWVNFDEVGTEADPDFQDTTGKTTYTTTENEVADIHDVARVIFKGPTNLTEWYFSTRLFVDIMAALYPYGPKYGLNFLHGDDVKPLPKIEFIAGQGMMGDTMNSIPQNGTKRILLPGYNHLDVLTASANTPTRRENGVIKPLIKWLMEKL